MPIMKDHPNETMADRVQRAAGSAMLWTMSVLDAMQHFRVSHDGLRQAKALAMELNPKEVAALLREKEASRRLERAGRIEGRHPGIHHRIAIGSECPAELARVYGLSRVRVGQIRDELSRIVQDLSTKSRCATALLAARAVERQSE